MLNCSFCLKREDEVSKLVAGPNVFICDGCVKLANDIIDRSGSAQPRAVRATQSRLRRVWNWFFGERAVQLQA